MALLPEEEREEMIETGFAESGHPLPEGMDEFLYELIDRKEQYFFQYTRQILSYQVTDRGRDYHLSVVSTL
jgi:hypothetical protein